MKLSEHHPSTHKKFTTMNTNGSHDMVQLVIYQGQCVKELPSWSFNFWNFNEPMCFVYLGQYRYLKWALLGMKISVPKHYIHSLYCWISHLFILYSSFYWCVVELMEEEREEEMVHLPHASVQKSRVMASANPSLPDIILPPPSIIHATTTPDTPHYPQLLCLVHHHLHCPTLFWICIFNTYITSQ